MKLSPIVLISFLPLLTLGNPIAEAKPANLESRADKWCTLFSGSDFVNCRAGTSTNTDVVRVIRAGERFGVRCKYPNAQPIFGNKVWDYIPGWGCYVSAHYTNNGCETGVPNC